MTTNKWAILAAIVVVAIAAQMFRYEYISQQIVGSGYIVRIDRLTRDRCLGSGPPVMIKDPQRFGLSKC